MSVTFACDDRDLQWRWNRALHGLGTAVGWRHGERFMTDSDLPANLLADDILPGMALAAVQAALRQPDPPPEFTALPLAAIAYEVWLRTRESALLSAAYAAGLRDAIRLAPHTGLAPACTLYATQRALAILAAALGDTYAASRWRQRQEATRQTLMQRYYRPGVAGFPDGDGHLSLLPLVAGVIDPPTLQRIWQRHLATPLQRCREFDSPLAPHLPRWLEQAGKPAAASELLLTWLSAPLVESTPSRLRQSEAISRVHGVHRHAGGLAWNCRSLSNGRQHLYRRHVVNVGDMAIDQQLHTAELRLNGGLIAQVDGACRVITDNRGRVAGVVGTASTTVGITIACEGATQHLVVDPDGLALL